MSLTKSTLRFFAVFLLLVFVGQMSSNAAARFWVGGPNASWAATTSWSTASGGGSGAAIPTSADDVTFDSNSGTVTATNVPTVTIRSLTVTGTANVTLQGAGANTLSVAIGSATTSVTIASTATLQLGTGTNTIALAVATTSGQTVNISGNLIINTGGTFGTNVATTTVTVAASTGAVTLNAGSFIATNSTVTVNGTFTNNGGTVTGTIATVGASGVYNHGMNGGTVPTVTTWTTTAPGATLNITGTTSTSPAGINQTFANLTLNCSGTVNQTGTATVAGVLTLTNGILNTNGQTLNLNGTLASGGAGTISTTATSTIAIGGAAGGNYGILNFTAAANTLGTLTVNRTGTTPSVDLGNALVLQTALNLTSGTLNNNSGAGSLTLGVTTNNLLTTRTNGVLGFVPSFGFSTGLYSVTYAASTATTTTGNELPSTAVGSVTGTFTNNNTVAGGTKLGANVNVNNATLGGVAATLDLNGFTFGVAGTYSNTSGTLNGTASTSTLLLNGTGAQSLSIGAYTSTLLSNLVISNTNTSTGATIATALTVTSLTINSGGYMSIGNVVLTVKGNVLNNGNLLNTTGNTSSVISMAGATAQTISGSGTWMVGTNSGYVMGLTIANTSGNVDLQIPLGVYGALTLSSGSLGTSNSSAFTLGAGVTSILLTTRTNGTLNIVPVFNLSNVTYNVTYGASTASITTGNELPAVGVATVTGTLTNNNTVAGGTKLGASVNVNNATLGGVAATLDLNGFTFGVAGTYSNTSGTLNGTASTSTLLLNGTGAQSLSIGAYTSTLLSNLVISNTNTSTGATIATALTVTSLTINSGGYMSIGNVILTVKGNVLNNGNLLNTTGNTASAINMNGATTQTISGSGNWVVGASTGVVMGLTINNSAGVDLQIPLGIYGALTLTSGALSSSTSSTLTLGAGVSSTLTVTRTGGSLTATSAFNLTSVTFNVIYGTNTTVSFTSGNEIPDAATAAISGTFTLNTTSTGTVTLNKSITVGGTWTNTTGILDIGANVLTLNGAVTMTAGSWIGSTSSDIVYGGSGAATLTLNTTTPGTTNVLQNLTINRSGATVTVGAAAVVNTQLNLNAGTLALAAQTLTLNGTVSSTSGNLTTTAGVLNLAGSSASMGTLAMATGTQTFASINFTNSSTTNTTASPTLTISGATTLQLSAASNALVMNGNASGGGVLAITSPLTFSTANSTFNMASGIIYMGNNVVTYTNTVAAATNLVSSLNTGSAKSYFAFIGNTGGFLLSETTAALNSGVTLNFPIGPAGVVNGYRPFSIITNAATNVAIGETIKMGFIDHTGGTAYSPTNVPTTDAASLNNVRANYILNVTLGGTAVGTTGPNVTMSYQSGDFNTTPSAAGNVKIWQHNGYWTNQSQTSNSTAGGNITVTKNSLGLTVLGTYPLNLGETNNDVSTTTTWTWTGGAGTVTWATPGNWSPLSTPTSAATTNIIINNSAVTQPTMTGAAVSVATITVGTGCTLTIPASGNLSINGADVAGVPAFNVSGSVTTASGSTVTYAGTGTQTIAPINYYTLVSSSTGARTLSPTGTIGVATAFTVGTNTYTTTNSTVNFNGAATVALLPGSAHYYNLTVSSTASLGGATFVDNNLTIGTGATLSDATFQLSGPGTGAGSFTMNGTAVLTMTNTATASATGSLACFPLFASYSLASTSTVNFNAAAAQNIYAVPSPGFGNLSINTAAITSAKTANGSFIIQGNLTVANATSAFYDGGNTVTVNGNIANTGTINGAAGSAGTGEILMSSANAQTISGTGTNYGNLEFNNTNASGVTFTGTAAALLNVNGYLKVTNGSLFMGNFTTGVTITGTTTVSDGTNTATLNINGATGAKTFTGDFTVNANGTYTSAVAATVNINGNIQNNGTINSVTSGTYTLGGTGAKTINATTGNPITMLCTALNITNTTGYTNYTTLTTNTLGGAGKYIAGTNSSLVLGGTGTGSVFATTTVDLTTNTPNTVTYASNAAQSVRTGTGTSIYYNLTIDKSAGIATLLGASTINGDLLINSGTFADGTFLITGPGAATGKTLTMNGTAGLTLTNTSATPLPVFQNYTLATTSTVSYNGDATQNITGGITYGNLTLSSGATAARTKTATSSLTVGGNFSYSSGIAGSVFALGNNNTITYNGTIALSNATLSGTAGPTSSIAFGGNSTTTLPAVTNTLLNLTIGTTGTITLGAATTIAGALNMNTGILNTGAQTLTLNGTITNGSGPATLSSSTNTGVLVLSGTGGGNMGTLNLTGGAQTFNSLTFSRSGTTPSATISGNLTLGLAGTELTMNSTNGVLNIGGNLTLNSTSAAFTLTQGIVSMGSNNVQYSGPVASMSSTAGSATSYFSFNGGTGGFQWTMPNSTAAGTYRWPVGDAGSVTGFRPVSLQTLSANPASAVSVKVGFIDDDGSGTVSATEIPTTGNNRAGYIANVTVSGALPTANMTMAYQDADFNAGAPTISTVAIYRYSGSQWSRVGNSSTGTANGNNIITKNSVSVTAGSQAYALGVTGGNDLQGNTYTWVGGTSTAWNDPTNWDLNNGSFPNDPADNVVIDNTYTPTNWPVIPNSVTYSVNNISVSGGGSLIIGATGGTIATLQVYGNFTTTGGTVTGYSLTPFSTVNFMSTGAQTVPAANYYNLTCNGGAGARTFTSTGTIGVAGALTLGTNTYTTTGSTIDFNGSGAQTIPTQPTTGFYQNVSVSTGGIKTLQAATTINGDLTINTGATLADGTFLLSGPGAASGKTFTINGTGVFTSTNANTTTTTAVIGSFPVFQTYNLASTSTFNSNAATAQPIPAITYGNLSLAGAATKTAAGSITVNGNYTSGAGLTFSIGANTITFNGLMTNSGTLTGGATSNIIMGGTGATTNLPAVTLNNLTINRASGIGAAGALTVAGVLDLTQGTLTVAAGITLTANGTVTYSSPGTGNLNGTATSTLLIGGTTGGAFGTLNFATATPNFGTVTINRTGASPSVDLGTNLTVQTALNLTSGVVTASTGGLTMGINAASTLTMTRSGGSLSGFTPTFNLTGVIFNAVYGNGTAVANIATGTEIPYAPTNINNFTSNNPTNGTTLTNNVSLGSAGILTLTAGPLTLGSNNLTVNNTASTAVTGTYSATNMVVADGAGQLVRAVPVLASSTAFAFPVGDATGTVEYSPVTLTFTSNTSTTRLIGVRVTDAQHPNDGTGTNYFSRYWSFTDNQNGTGTYTYTPAFTGLAADIVGTYASIYLDRWDGSSWTQYNNSGTTPNLTVSTALTNVTGSIDGSDWTGRVNQATYVWNQTATADWQVASNWTPNRLSPSSNDILTFNNGAATTANNIPSQAIAQLIINGSTNVTLVAAAASTTLSINGPAATNNLVVGSGSTLTLGSTNTFTLSMITTTTQKGDISGTLNVNANNTFNPSAITTAPGVLVTGSITNNGGTITGSTNGLTFGNGSFYNHAMNGGTIPTATYYSAGTYTTSTVNITGIVATNPTWFAGAYSNVTWNNASQTSTGALSGAITVNGALNIQAGTLADGAFQITGNSAGSVNLAAGTTLQIGAGTATVTAFPTNFTAGNITVSPTSTVIYNSTGAQSVSNLPQYGNLTLSGASVKTVAGAASQLTVNGNLTVNAGTLADGAFQIVGNSTGTLTVAASSTLQIGAGTATITSFPTNFLTSNITLNATSTVNYNTVTNTQSIAVSNGTTGPATYGNLTVTGASGIKQLTANTTVQGNLSIATSGETLNLNNFNLSVAGTYSNSGILNGSASSSTLTLNGSASQNFAIGNYTGSLLSNLVIANTNASGVVLTTTGVNVTNVTINASSLLNLNALALTIGGIYTNNGTLNGSNASSTLAFNGSSGAQNFTIGTYTSSTLGKLTIANTGSGSTTLGAPVNVSGVFTLTSGILTTSSTNTLTVTATAATSVVGGSATSYVNGPFTRTLPASLATGTSYSFPVGKSAYQLFTLNNPTTSSAGTVAITAESFDANAGGTAGAGLTSLSTSRYWNASASGSGAITAIGSVALTETGLVNGTSAVGQSSTQTGTYQYKGGTVAGSVITTVGGISTGLGYFVIGNKNVNLCPGPYTVGPTGDFASLADVAGILNGATISCDLLFELQPTYTSSSESFPIVFTNITNPSNTITIRPGSGVSSQLVTSGDPGTSNPLININGADNMIFDGRPGGTGTAVDWIIRNTRTASTVGPALQLQSGANNNTFQYLQIESQNTQSASGTVFITANAAPATTNSGDIIQNCNITTYVSGATTHLNAIYALGNASTQFNNNIQILNNNISNFTPLITTAATGITVSGTGLNTSGYGSGWTISGNSFFKSASESNLYMYIAINFIPSPTGVASTGNTISGNYIGGNASALAGSAISGIWATGAAPSNQPAFQGITVNANGCTVSNNVIGGVFDYNISSQSGFTGIYVPVCSSSGSINITGNTIGSTYGAGNLYFTSSTTSVAIGTGSKTFTVAAGMGYQAGDRVRIATQAAQSSIYAYYMEGTVTSYSGTSLTVNVDLTFGSGTLAAWYVTLAYGMQSSGQWMGEGIWVGQTSMSTCSITNNTIANLYNTDAVNSVDITAGIIAQNGTYTITGNTVYNLAANCATTSSILYVNVDGSVVGIAQQGVISNAVQTVSNNTVYNLYNALTSASATKIYGITLAGTTSASVTHTADANFVHSLAANNTNTLAQIYGIYMNSGTYNITNNMVRLGIRADGTSITGSAVMQGITDAEAGSSTTGSQKFYHNSVYIGGTGVASGTINTYGFRRNNTNTSPKDIVDLRNNIFVNNRSNASGTGAHYCIGFDASTQLSSSTEDYNDCYGNGTGFILGQVVGAATPNCTSYALLRTGSGNASFDLNSIIGDPQFISPTTATPNLHIQGSPTATPIESAGTAAATLTADIDGDIRASHTPVDIGADAGDFIPIDNTAPTISYTALANVCNNGSTTNNVTGIAISDASSINTTTGTAPRLYYKKSTDANAYNGNTSATVGWKYVEASNTSSPFSFTIDYTLLNSGSVSAADVIQYFVVAQDLSSNNNVGINSGTFTAAPTSVALTSAAFPITGTINSYSVLPCSGTVTVGTGGNYPSGFTPNGALFQAINSIPGGLTGNLVASVVGDMSIEDGVNALNGTALNGHTFTIQPSAATTYTISGTAVASASPMIPFNGASNVTIDGNFSGSGQYLKFRNTNATAANAGPTIQFNNSCTSDNLRNCIIESNASTATTGAVLIGTTGTNTGITISNNSFTAPTGGTISNPANGVYSNSANNNTLSVTSNTFNNWTNAGVLFTNVGNSCSITGNSFFQTTTLATAQTAISVQAGNAHTISNNYIGGQAASAGGSALTNSGAVAFTGISLSVGTTTATSVQNNTIKNISMTSASAGAWTGINVAAGLVNIGTTTGNTIGDASTANSLSYAGSGIVTGIKSASTSTATISNNTVGNLHATATGNTAVQVIGVSTTAGTNTISNNTITSLVNDALTTTTGASASLIGISQTSTTAGQSISHNTISALTHSSTSSAVVILGIHYTGATSGTNTIEKNFIHSFSWASPAAIATGINVVGGASTYRNNVIRLGIDNTGASLIQRAVITGIDKNTTANNNFYFNSVYIGGSGVNTTTATNTYAFRREQSGTDDVRNNIFVNARSNSSGTTNKHYAIAYNNATSLTSNYNIYYAPNTGGNLGSYDGGTTPQTTMQAFSYTSGTNQDAGSGYGDPSFANPTAATPDLHITGTSPAEGAGILIASVIDDYDGDTRSAHTPTDIGADAADVTPSDIFRPVVVVTTIPNQSSACGSSISIPVTATVTDVGNSGLATGSLAPTLWWRLSTGTWAALLPSSSAGNTFNYTLNLTGVAAGQTYQYYVAAQDQASTPNIGYSNYNATTPVHADVSTFPSVQNGNPGSFTITSNSPLSGTVTVGTGGTYTSLTHFDGLFAAINANGLKGNLTVNVISDITEDGNQSLYQWTEYCGTGYTVTIQPSAATLRTLSGSLIGMGLFNIYASRVTIDGSFGGSGRYLKFANTYSGTGGSENDVFKFDYYGASSFASNDVLKNCEIVGASTKAAGGVIYLASGCYNITIDNNLIHGDPSAWANNIILCDGALQTNHDISITNNEIYNFLAWSGGTTTRSYGINVTANSNGSNWTITGNSIYNTGINGQNVQTALRFYPGASSTGNTISNNWIGGSSAQCGTGGGVTYWGNSYDPFNTTEVRIYGMDINAGTITLDGNNMTNIDISSCDYTGFVCMAIGGSTVATVTNNVFGTGTAGTPSNTKLIKVEGGGCSSGVNGYIYGIWNTSSTTSTTTYDGNYFYYLWQSGAYYGGSVQCILHQTSGPATITNNTINGPQAAGMAYSSGWNSFGIRLEPNASTSGNLIEHNLIAGPYINVTSSLGYGSNNFGIRVLVLSTYTVSGTIDRNVVWDMRNADYGGTGVTEGIYVYSTTGGNGNWNIYNNQVALKNNGSTGNCVGLYGIEVDLNSSSTTNVQYNSVYISGSNGGAGLAGADFSSYAFFRQPGGSGSVVGDALTLKNNILVNWRLVSTSAVSGHFAIGNVGTSNYASGWNTSNYNFLAVANGSKSFLGEWGTATKAAIANWRTASGTDANSGSATYTAGATNYASGTLNADNLFSNPLSDLHISLADGQSYQYIDGKATPITITTDYDGDARDATTPDIGADETSACTSPTVSTQPSNQTVCASANATFNVTATGTATLTYQWKESTNGGTTFNNITNGGIYSGATTNALTLTGVTAGMTSNQYQCVITNSCGNITTSNVTLTVNSAPSISAYTPSTFINTICSGSNTSFGVTASGAGLTYLWEVSTNGGTSWSTVNNGGVYSTATTNTVNISNTPATMDGYKYRVTVSGTCPSPVVSTTGTLNVNTSPNISTQPSNTSACVGDNATFTVTTTGSGLSYQWMEDQGSGFANVNNGGIYSGANSASLVLTGVTSGMNGYNYKCVITGLCSPAATSNTVSLTINTPPAITAYNPVSWVNTICSGSTTAFTVTTTGTGLTYQWQVDQGSGFNNVSNGGAYSGATTNGLTISNTPATMNGYTYRCIVTGTCPSPVTSNVGTLNVNASPNITANPVDANICASSNANFSVTATGGGLSYQWQEDQGGGYTNITNGGVYSGATSTSLTLTGVTTAMDGYHYRCVVTGLCAPPATSTGAVLNIGQNTIATQPASTTTACAGSNATISLSVTGLHLTYQWQESTDNGATWNGISNGGVYSGATTNTLTLTGITSGMNNYQYRCVVSTVGCSNATSTASTLNIATPAISSTTPGANCGTGTVSLSASATAGTINWYTSLTGGTSQGTGTTFVTPSISTTTNYYVDATLGTCVSTPRVQVTATIDPTPTVTAVLDNCACYNAAAVFQNVVVVRATGGTGTFTFTPITGLDAVQTTTDGNGTNYTGAHSGVKAVILSAADGLTHQYTVSDGICSTTLSRKTQNGLPVGVPFESASQNPSGLPGQGGGNGISGAYNNSGANSPGILSGFVNGPALTCHQSADFGNTWVSYMVNNLDINGNPNTNDSTNNKVAVEINNYGQDLDSVAVSIYREPLLPAIPSHAGAAGACYQYPVNALERHYVIQSSRSSGTNVFSDAVGVRLYFSDAELEDLKYWTNFGAIAEQNGPNASCAAAQVVNNLSQLYVTKYTGTNEDGDYTNNVPSGLYRLFGANTNSALGNGPAYYDGGNGNGVFGNSLGANRHFVEIGVHEFSEFWLSGSGDLEALPVEMISFEADPIDNQYIQLRWATAIEINNKEFQVERSTDGQTWSQIGIVGGNGNTTSTTNYMFNDMDVKANVKYYYRLKQVDFNMDYKYTGIVSAMLIAADGFSMNIAPNPTNGYTNLIINTSKDEEVEVSIFDVIGQKVVSGNHQLNAGVNHIEFELGQLASGTYSVTVTAANQIYTKKLVITK